MMRTVEKKSKPLHHVPMPLCLIEARVMGSPAACSYLLDDGSVAQQAISCLIRPEPGDHVLVAASHDETPYILHVLSRNNLQQAHLSVPGVQQLCINQNQLQLNASDSIALNALTDIELNAATGVLNINARNLFTTVSETLVQNVQHFVGQAEHYLIEVKQLLRLHSQQALITAEKDIKVDAERISMG